MALYDSGAIPVEEWRGKNLTEWDSLSQCARAHGVGVETIKLLIHLGGSLDGYAFFDLPIDAPYDTRQLGKRSIEIYDTLTGKIVSKGARVIPAEHKRIRT